MNFQNLEYFLAVAEEHSITRAAARLHISQQALSGQLQRMEEELGCRLFERRRDLELTYSGKCLQKEAVQVLGIHRQTKSMIDDANASLRGELRIGISHTRGQAILPLVLPDFSKRFPLVELTAVEASTSDLEKELEAGSIDVLIGYLPFMTDCAETTLLMKEHLFLVIPKQLLRSAFGNGADAVLARYRETGSLAIFRDLPFVLLKKGDRIRDIADREFARAGISPEVRIETLNIQTAFSLAAAGMGITVYPELYLTSPYTVSGYPDSVIRAQAEIVPFINSTSSDKLAIGYNRNRYLTRFAEEFIRLCAETLGGQQASAAGR